MGLRWLIPEAMRYRTGWKTMSLSLSTIQVTNHPTTPEHGRRHPPLTLQCHQGIYRSVPPDKSWTSWKAMAMFQSPLTSSISRPTMNISEREPAGTSRKPIGKNTSSMQKILTISPCQRTLARTRKRTTKTILVAAKKPLPRGFRKDCKLYWSKKL